MTKAGPRFFLIALWLSLVLPLLSSPNTHGDASPNRSVEQLIDNLTQIDSRAPGLDGTAMYEGFIADNRPGTFVEGVLGFAPPKVPPAMAELVRRGPLALPNLVQHLSDSRPTKFAVGNIKDGSSKERLEYMFSYFGNEYDPRTPYWIDPDLTRTRESVKREVKQMREKSFDGRYSVKVGDVCYTLIGQIVNRQLVAVRYQPSFGLVVNSPIETPELAEKVRRIGGKQPEALRKALLEDIRAANRPKFATWQGYTDRFVNPALQRLRFYFPDTYNRLEGEDLEKKRNFEKQEVSQRRRSIR